MNANRKFKSILVTGGAGFIGSHLVRRLVHHNFDSQIVNLDALTYAGNLENLKDLEGHKNYGFIQGDIRDCDFLSALFQENRFEAVVHLAAETHVDRSIDSATPFIQTNVQGTANLLDTCRSNWEGNLEGKLFLHVSTDEVFGSCATGAFDEKSPYRPNSPYAASKAASDHLVRAYGITFDLPYVLSNCSNNYGPNQFPEKLIPLFINNILEEKPLPLYGDGRQVRDWLYVTDHAAALELLLYQGKPFETYCVGGGNELQNIEIANRLCDILERVLGRPEGYYRKLIEFVKDRPGHDHRYAIDASKITRDLGWQPAIGMDEGLEKTVTWYLENTTWLKSVTSGGYRDYYTKMYKGRKQTEL